MREHEFDISTQIGGWYMSKKVIDDISKFWKTHKDKSHKGEMRVHGKTQVIKSIKEVLENKHARFDAISRSSEYRILIGRDPFLLDTTWQIHQKKFQLEKMNEAAKVLFQYKDFESFSKVKTDVKTFNCKIMSAFWKLEGNQLIFYIKANRFLRNMVRAIVGTLLDVGLEKISLEDFRNIIESKKRSEAGLSVPAKGLFLTEVNY